MNVVTANDLKLRGVSSIEEGLKDQPEAMITVRGKAQYMVMNIEQYHHLREAELEAALLEMRNDLAQGNCITESAEAHVKRVFEQ